MSGGMLPQKFLKICVSKIAISSILREISYSSNTNFLLVNFAFVKKKKNPREGGGHRPLRTPPPAPFESCTAKIESDCDCDVHQPEWQSFGDF